MGDSFKVGYHFMVVKKATKSKNMKPLINQGDIFWIQKMKPHLPEQGVLAHPYVVIQDNLFNHSRLDRVVMCGLSSNLKRANEPGNVRVTAGEGGLTKDSVVIVSQLESVPKSQLTQYAGHLSPDRVNDILQGLAFLHKAFYQGR